MAILAPTPFAHLARRMTLEHERQGAIFDLPENKWWKPGPEELRRTRCRFHGRHAGGPFGPAAGPQDQMAQNIVLSYLAGGRIMELKTVQIMDELEIGRPCIDAATVGYNIEWSQELKLRESLEEYAKAAMLVHILQNRGICGGQPEDDQVVYDISVGYDLKGIQSPTVREFMAGMLDASAVIDRLRMEIPDDLKELRDLDYPTRLAGGVTLSTFHGCPPHEIEKICEHLIGDYGLHTVVKMNPTMLGRDRVEYLVREKLGYEEIYPRPGAFTEGLRFDESIDICRRLHALAKKSGVGFGAKFTNTLETENRDQKLPDKTKYASGRPLHVISSELLWRFRAAYGEPMEVTFSAGLEKLNAPETLAMGVVPATTCTDLLKTGGFARLTDYSKAWLKAQDEKKSDSWASWIFSAFDNGDVGARKAIDQMRGEVDPKSIARLESALDAPNADGHFAALWDEVIDPVNPVEPFEKLMVRAMFEIQLENARVYVSTLSDNTLYHKSRNSKHPPKIDSRLVTFDCLACDKCVPVCPNDANYYYMVAKEEEFTPDILSFDGSRNNDGGLNYSARPGRAFAVAKEHQIANFADWCNECGNCDTFCPEYDGPYIMKPSFFGSRRAFEADPKHEGFHAWRDDEGDHIVGRMEGRACSLDLLPEGDAAPTDGARYAWREEGLEVRLGADNAILSARDVGAFEAPMSADLWRFHCLRKLLEGAFDARRVTSVNAPFLAAK